MYSLLDFLWYRWSVSIMSAILCYSRDGFRAVVISTLDPYEYEAALADCIPLGYMQPIYVNPND